MWGPQLSGTSPSQESTITIRKSLAAFIRFGFKSFEYIQSMSKRFLYHHYTFFQPMLDYVDSKERQGIFFEKPSERIHLPEPAELALMDHSKCEVNDRVEAWFSQLISEESDPAAAESGTLPLSRDTARWPRRATPWQVLILKAAVFASLLTDAFMLSVRTFNSFVRGSKDNTTLEAKLTSAMLRNAFRSIQYPFPHSPKYH